MESVIQSVVVGIITGLFSAGSVWGVLKTEMHFMRRDLDEVREKCLGLPCGGRHA